MLSSAEAVIISVWN